MMCGLPDTAVGPVLFGLVGLVPGSPHQPHRPEHYAVGQSLIARPLYGSRKEEALRLRAD